MPTARPCALPRLTATAAAVVALLLAGGCATRLATSDRQALPAAIADARAAALAAHAAGDRGATRAAQQRLATLLPNDPDVRLRLAAAEAADGDNGAACTSLAVLARSGLQLAPERDPRNAGDFAALGRDPCLLDWLSGNAANGRPKPASQRLHRFAERDALPSGLAWEPNRGAHLVTTLRGRRLLRIDADGRESALMLNAPERDWPLQAVAVDSRHDRLWIAAAEGSRATLAGYALSTGQRRVSLPLGAADGAAASLPALALLDDGRVLVADAGGGRIWQVDADQASYEVLADGFATPRALALAADGRSVHVADTALGLWTMALPGGDVRRVVAEPWLALTGITGLVRDGATLIAVQGGVRPPRIVRWTLADGGRRISDQTVLEQGVETLGSPGAARIDGDLLIFVAHDGRDRLGADGRTIATTADAPAPELRQLPLTAISGP